LTAKAQLGDDLIMRKTWWILLFLATVPVSQTVAQPSLGAGAIVNGASFAKAADPNGALAPGTIVSAFGANLATGTQLALSVPLSANINGSSLIFSAGGVDYPAPLFFVSTGQINAQVPFNVPTSGVVTARATFNGSSASNPVSMFPVSPGIFANNGVGAILHNADFTAVTSANPAAVGEFVVIYCTGLGPLSPALASGVPAPGAPPFPMTTIQALAFLDSTQASVVYQGAAPSFVGLYQVSIQVPNVAPGDHQVVIATNGVKSNLVTMTTK
jgi:uncharacterized protein (TIGR03437 family)